ncbi:MutS domain V protein [Trichuris suis]|nr:MutS domain V protein [Trichuris suis]
MKDMSYILNNFTNESLILIDELGRNTSEDEGYACCVAICERFMTSEAFVLLVTHYLDLVELDRLYPYVDSYHFEAPFDSARKQVQPSHKLLRGLHAGPAYGFELAEIAMFPQDVINNAKQLLEELRSKKKKQNEESSCQLRKQRAVMRLRHRLAQVIKMTDVENSVLMGYLNQLKESYLKEVDAIDSNAE